MLQDAPLTVLDYTMNKGGTLNFTSLVPSLSLLGTKLYNLTYFMVISFYTHVIYRLLDGLEESGVTGKLNTLTSKDISYLLSQNLLTMMSICASFSVMKKSVENEFPCR